MTSEEAQRESFYEAAEDPPEVGVDNAAESFYQAAEEASILPKNDAPPPLPVRDDDDGTLYESIVPPSPMTKEEHGYKFLEDEPLYQVIFQFICCVFEVQYFKLSMKNTVANFTHSSSLSTR